MPKNVFFLYEISRYCNTDISRILEWINEGKLPAAKTSTGEWIVNRDDLIEFLRRNQLPIPPDLQKAPLIRVVVVDEDPAQKENVVKALEELGMEYQLQSAKDGVEAISKFAVFNPDLIITELKLPLLDGLEILRQIRTHYPRTISIIITSYPSIQTVVEVMRLGAYDYIPKPFDPSGLARVIKECIEKHRRLKGFKKIDELISLYEVSKAMSSLMDVDRLLELILETACSTLKADGGSIMLLNPKTEELEVRVAAGTFKDTVIGKHLKLGERIAGRTAKFGEPILVVGDLAKDSRFKGLKKYEDIKSGISIPLIFKDKLIGVFNLKRTRIAEIFTDRDIRLLSILGEDVAYAVEHARVYTELIEKAQELARLTGQLKEWNSKG